MLLPAYVRACVYAYAFFRMCVFFITGIARRGNGQMEQQRCTERLVRI